MRKISISKEKIIVMIIVFIVFSLVACNKEDKLISNNESINESNKNPEVIQPLITLEGIETINELYNDFFDIDDVTQLTLDDAKAIGDLNSLINHTYEVKEFSVNEMDLILLSGGFKNINYVMLFNSDDSYLDSYIWFNNSREDGSYTSIEFLYDENYLLVSPVVLNHGTGIHLLGKVLFDLSKGSLNRVFTYPMTGHYAYRYVDTLECLNEDYDQDENSLVLTYEMGLSINSETITSRVDYVYYDFNGDEGFQEEEIFSKTFRNILFRDNYDKFKSLSKEIINENKIDSIVELSYFLLEVESSAARDDLLYNCYDSLLTSENDLNYDDLLEEIKDKLKIKDEVVNTSIKILNFLSDDHKMTSISFDIPDGINLDFKFERKNYYLLDGDFEGFIVSFDHDDDFEAKSQLPNHSSVINEEIIEHDLATIELITLDADNGSAASGKTGTHNVYYAFIYLPEEKGYMIRFNKNDKDEATKTQLLNILESMKFVDELYPGYYAEEYLSQELPELERYGKHINIGSDGQAFLIIESRGNLENLTYKGVEGQYYMIYVGERWDDHQVNWYWFYVNKNLNEILWYDMAEIKVKSLKEWRSTPSYIKQSENLLE